MSLYQVFSLISLNYNVIFEFPTLNNGQVQISRLIWILEQILQQIIYRYILHHGNKNGENID